MLEDLKKEMKSFLKDLDANVKDEQDLIYVKTRTAKLLDIMMDEIDNLITFKEERLNAIIKKQEKEDAKIKELQEKLENVYQDIYECDEDFSVKCPYCGNEFDVWVDDENLNEIKCPECSNIIELDWGGNPDDDIDNGCGGNCSGCQGCE